MTIGRKRVARKVNDNPGAGSYNTEKAEALTKNKVPNVDMGKSPSRPVNFAKPGSDATGGPGSYDAGKKFMDDVKPFTIGRKRPKKIETGVPDGG